MASHTIKYYVFDLSCFIILTLKRSKILYDILIAAYEDRRVQNTRYSVENHNPVSVPYLFSVQMTSKI
jgi:hypothetical protein